METQSPPSKVLYPRSVEYLPPSRSRSIFILVSLIKRTCIWVWRLLSLYQIWIITRCLKDNMCWWWLNECKRSHDADFQSLTTTSPPTITALATWVESHNVPEHHQLALQSTTTTGHGGMGCQENSNCAQTNTQRKGLGELSGGQVGDGVSYGEFHGAFKFSVHGRFCDFYSY